MTKEEVTRREFGKSVILGGLAAAVPGVVIVGASQVQAEPLEQPVPLPQPDLARDPDCEYREFYLDKAARLFAGAQNKGPLVQPWKLTDPHGNMHLNPITHDESFWLQLKTKPVICSLSDQWQAREVLQRAMKSMSVQIYMTMTAAKRVVYDHCAFTVPRYLGGRPVNTLQEEPDWAPATEVEAALVKERNYFSVQIVSYVYMGDKPTLRQPAEADLSRDALSRSIDSYVLLRQAAYQAGCQQPATDSLKLQELRRMANYSDEL